MELKFSNMYSGTDILCVGSAHLVEYYTGVELIYVFKLYVLGVGVTIILKSNVTLA